MNVLRDEVGTSTESRCEAHCGALSSTAVLAGLVANLFASIGCGAMTTSGDRQDASALDTFDALPLDVRHCEPTALFDASTNTPPPDGLYVVDLSVEIMSQCARMSDGTLHCRGMNNRGQLGNGTTIHSFEHTTRVVGIDNAEQVVVGLESACARLRDGTVRCWGSNRDHALGTGHADDENCGSHEVPDPCRLRPAEVPGLTDVVHLTASMFTYCAVRRDGSVWCWGGRGFPANIEASNAPTPVRMPGLDDIAWLRPLGLAWLARHEDGRYEALVWGAGPPRVPRDASVPDGIRTDHLCYVLPDTSMRCQGANHSGQVGNGTSSFPEGVTEPWDPGLCGVRSIVTGGRHTCALLADRRVWCWGDTVNDDNGDLATERCVGVNAVIRCVTHPTLVEGLDDVVEIFAGTWSTCAIRMDHTVWCWGSVAPERSTRPARTEW